MDVFSRRSVRFLDMATVHEAQRNSQLIFIHVYYSVHEDGHVHQYQKVPPLFKKSLGEPRVRTYLVISRRVWRFRKTLVCSCEVRLREVVNEVFAKRPLYGVLNRKYRKTANAINIIFLLVLPKSS